MTRILGPAENHVQLCGAQTETLSGIEPPLNVDRPYSMTVDPLRDRVFIFEQNGQVFFSRKDGTCRVPVLGRGGDGKTSETKLTFMASKRIPGGIGVNPRRDLFNGVFFAFAAPSAHKFFDVRITGTHIEIGTGTPGFEEPDDINISPVIGAIDDVNLDTPRAVAMNHQGDLFIAEQANHRILRVRRKPAAAFESRETPNFNDVEVFAGSSVEGYNEDGADPFAWQFSSPSGLSWDFAKCTSNADCAPLDAKTICATTESAELDCLQCKVSDGRCFYNQPTPGLSVETPAPVFGDALLVADQGNHRIVASKFIQETTFSRRARSSALVCRALPITFMKRGEKSR
ncbi:MAG: hypothetical protein GY822_16710 [Deltaproteobacteria bacterium]|nr:hypothetical protein [Deltaproteobacteria bacterium]